MKILIDMNLSPEWVVVFAQHRITAVHWSTVGNPRAEDSVLMDWLMILLCSRMTWILARCWR
jgi:predicted nuclease of predicted toxin-antitoxin system